ncbi:MAG: hypothetical protein P8Z30_08015 [Acidobacteriota bacterium]
MSLLVSLGIAAILVAACWQLRAGLGSSMQNSGYSADGTLPVRRTSFLPGLCGNSEVEGGIGISQQGSMFVAVPVKDVTSSLSFGGTNEPFCTLSHVVVN